jgi:hypothetical protein
MVTLRGGKHTHGHTLSALWWASAAAITALMLFSRCSKAVTSTSPLADRAEGSHTIQK